MERVFIAYPIFIFRVGASFQDKVYDCRIPMLWSVHEACFATLLTRIFEVLNQEREEVNLFKTADEIMFQNKTNNEAVWLCYLKTNALYQITSSLSSVLAPAWRSNSTMSVQPLTEAETRAVQLCRDEEPNNVSLTLISVSTQAPFEMYFWMKPNLLNFSSHFSLSWIRWRKIDRESKNERVIVRKEIHAMTWLYGTWTVFCSPRQLPWT